MFIGFYLVGSNLHTKETKEKHEILIYLFGHFECSLLLSLGCYLGASQGDGKSSSVAHQAKTAPRLVIDSQYFIIDVLLHIQVQNGDAASRTPKQRGIKWLLNLGHIGSPEGGVT